MRRKVLYSVYNISGYLIAGLGELTKIADVVVMESPCRLSEACRNRFNSSVRWIDRKSLLSPNDALKALRGEIPDVYICGGWHDPVYFGLAKLLHRMGVTTVVSIDTPWECRFRQIVHCLISRIYLTPVFDCAWGAGEPQEKYLRYLGFSRRRIRRGTYCADTNKFSPIGSEKLRVKDGGEQLKWPHSFLYIGRYAPAKNMRMMERAFIRAIDEMPESDWTLRCIGGGELWDERTIHPRIEHLGYKSPMEIQNYVMDAGCFVLPSVYEPWGVVVHEAALMGLPLLCSNQIQAATQFLKDGENGYAFNPVDEGTIVASFVRIMKLGDTVLRAMGERSNRLGMGYTLMDWVTQVMEFAK